MAHCDAGRWARVYNWPKRSRKRHFARYWVIRMAILLAVIADTFRRIFQGTRPIDYVMLIVEVFVLLIIALEGIAHAVHRLRVRRRVKRLRPFQATGLALQDEFRLRFRSSNDATGEAVEWIDRIDKWTAATSEHIKRYSLEATAAFLRDSGGVIMKYGNQNSIFATYERLESRLNNLHGIIETADLYF